MASNHKHSAMYDYIEGMLRSYGDMRDKMIFFEKAIADIQEAMYESGFTATAYNSERVQNSRISRQVEEAVVKKVGKLIKIQAKYNELSEKLFVMDAFIESLNEQQDKEKLYIISRHFRDGVMLKDIAVELGRGDRTIGKKKHKALCNLMVTYSKEGRKYGFK